MTKDFEGKSLEITLKHIYVAIFIVIAESL